MKTKDAIKWAGTVRRLANRMQISTMTIYKWGEYPPIAKQCQIEVISHGELKAERSQLHDDYASY